MRKYNDMRVFKVGEEIATDKGTLTYMSQEDLGEHYYGAVAYKFMLDNGWVVCMNEEQAEKL